MSFANTLLFIPLALNDCADVQMEDSLHIVLGRLLFYVAIKLGFHILT